MDGIRAADFTVPPDRAVQQVLEHRPAVVFLTSPNNPTGTALPLATVRGGARAWRPGWSSSTRRTRSSPGPACRRALTLLPGHPRLVVTRTMSKAFGMAGLRLGYLAADPAVVDALQLVRLPYHLSALTQRVARVALAHAPELLATVRGGEGASGTGSSPALPALGLTAVPSDANFVLFGRFADARAAWRALLDRGVLVRDPGLPGWLRVTAGTPAGGGRVPGRAGRGRRRGGGTAREQRTGRVRARDEASRRCSSRSTSTAPARTDVETGVPFYDHMLSQLGRHGGFDLTVRTKGDLEIDAHHTVEDTAIALGEAFRQALGDKAGIRRFGDALVPLDESLAQVAVDLSGRPYLVHDEPDGMPPTIGPVYATHADPARLRVVRAQRRGSRCTCGCSAGGTRTTSSRRSSRPSPGRCATRPRSTRGSPACPSTKGVL